MSDMSNPTDWDELFRQQIPDALRLAIRLTGNLHDAEDILQESLLRAARFRSSFRGECPIRMWIGRIVVNVFRTWIARQRTSESLIDDPPEKSRPEDCLIADAERNELVARYVSRLPPRQREVLVFCVYENLTAAQVAELLGLSEQNVYSSLSAAKRQLRESLSFLMARGADS